MQKMAHLMNLCETVQVHELFCYMQCYFENQAIQAIASIQTECMYEY